jgi:hypothetical protein
MLGPKASRSSKQQCAFHVFIEAPMPRAARNIFLPVIEDDYKLKVSLLKKSCLKRKK